MAAAWSMLSAIKITEFLQALQDVRELPNELKFLGRTAVRPATDGEINARYISRVQIADLITDNSKARVYKFGKFQFVSNQIPNIKLGFGMDQEEINQLQAIRSNTAMASNDIFPNFIQDHMDALLLGIRQRWETMIIAMQLDSWTYNRLGIVMTGVRFGMPNDLKVTVSPAWTSAATANPVADTLTQKRYAQVRYGEVYDRMTMSLAVFILMVATTEFQNKARTFLAPNVSFVNLNVQNTDFMKSLAQNVLGMKEIELYDNRFWSQDTSGVTTSAPFLPINQVIFSSTSDDNRPQVSDLANGILTESLISGMVNSNIVGSLRGPTAGPAGWVTPTDANMNPPGIVMWGAARSFPRRKRPTMTSVFTVGTVTETIPVGEPFTGLGY